MPAVPGPPHVERRTPGRGVQARREVGGQLLRPAARRWRWGTCRRLRRGDLPPIWNTDGCAAQVAQESDHLVNIAHHFHLDPHHPARSAPPAGRRRINHRRFRAVDYNPRRPCSPTAMGLNETISLLRRVGCGACKPSSAGRVSLSIFPAEHGSSDRGQPFVARGFSVDARRHPTGGNLRDVISWPQSHPGDEHGQVSILRPRRRLVPHQPPWVPGRPPERPRPDG